MNTQNTANNTPVSTESGPTLYSVRCNVFDSEKNIVGTYVAKVRDNATRSSEAIKEGIRQIAKSLNTPMQRVHAVSFDSEILPYEAPPVEISAA